MKYRVFNKLEKPVSLLGMGCMRLPVINGNNEAIDEAAAIALIRTRCSSSSKRNTTLFTRPWILSLAAALW